MSNCLSVRSVMVQTLDEYGEPEGEPTYGVMAADSYEQSYNDMFDTFEELQKAISEADCILSIAAENDEFAGYDPEKIGHDNFYGGDWQSS